MAPNIKEILSKEIFTLKIQPFRKQFRNERLCIIKELSIFFLFSIVLQKYQTKFQILHFDWSAVQLFKNGLIFEERSNTEVVEQLNSVACWINIFLCY
jgi:hypothetical protein